MCNALKLSLVVLAAVLGVVSQAQAGLIVGDNFSYPDGALAGNSGGTNGDANNHWGLGAVGTAWDALGAPSSGSSVSGGQVFTNSGTQDQRWFTANFNGVKDTVPLYWSATFSVDSSSSMEAYVAIGASNSTDLSTVGKNMLAIGVNSDQFVALAGNNQSKIGTIVPSTSYQIVGKTTFNNDTTIWVNPTGAEGGGALYTTSATSGYDTNWLTPGRLDITGYGSTGVYIDNFKLGTDWASVQATVPEPGTIVMLAAGLFGLLAYAWRKRK